MDDIWSIPVHHDVEVCCMDCALRQDASLHVEHGVGATQACSGHLNVAPDRGKRELRNLARYSDGVLVILAAA